MDRIPRSVSSNNSYHLEYSISQKKLLQDVDHNKEEHKLLDPNGLTEDVGTITLGYDAQVKAYRCLSGWDFFWRVVSLLQMYWKKTKFIVK